jgi:hypothetical protein
VSDLKKVIQMLKQQESTMLKSNELLKEELFQFRLDLKKQADKD